MNKTETQVRPESLTMYDGEMSHDISRSEIPSGKKNPRRDPNTPAQGGCCSGGDKKGCSIF